MTTQYELYWKRFNIEQFIERTASLDILNLLNACSNERRDVEKITISPKMDSYRDIEYRKNQYWNFLGGLAYILMNGSMAASFSDSDKRLAKSVIQRLVNEGQLKADTLDIFN